MGQGSGVHRLWEATPGPPVGRGADRLVAEGRRPVNLYEYIAVFMTIITVPAILGTVAEFLIETFGN